VKTLGWSAACTARGKITGASVEAIVHARTVADASLEKRALYDKYGWLFGAFELIHRVQRKTAVMLEIVRPDVAAVAAVRAADLDST
jgi:hypothetical protein